LKRHALALLVSAAACTGVDACDYCLIGQGISPLQTRTGAGLRVARRYTLLDSIYEGDSELGNLSPLGRYTFHSRHTLDATTLLAGVFGIKLPTGSTSRRDDQGEYLDSHLQPGTGSTDLLLGISADHALGRYAASANLLASIAGEGETGSESHRFGNSLNYDVTLKYRVTPVVSGGSSNSFLVSLGVNGEYRAKEELDGITLQDTGGHTVYLTPGLQYRMASHRIFEATYQQAVYHDLNEMQLGENHKLSGSAT